MHTLKPIQDSLFSIQDSRDADLAIELQDLDHKWRWECYLLGPKTSARVLSRHLIFPLMSVANLAFTSADSVSECSTADLQTLVDKVAKAGRRTEDIHVRQTISRPRVAMTLARLTALFNFSDDVPAIIDEAEEIEDVDIEMPMNTTHDVLASKIDLPPSNRLVNPEFINNATSPQSEIISHEANPSLHPNVTPASRQKHKRPDNNGAGEAGAAPPLAMESDGSATEPESADEDTRAVPKFPQDSEKEANIEEESVNGSAAGSPHQDESDSSSSPPKPPSKKAKHRRLDSEDSGSSSNAVPSATRTRAPVRAGGVRQPIRRGGRKF
ncbi:hypothetical protein BU17DRAFT_69647 [Hysterangium stoloniferum]|nr:hypothetical protein BU17DRAFT_69647 [Hysterangium stoloniferum]